MGKIVKCSDGVRRELGEDTTCVIAASDGWGSGCRHLFLTKDNHYQCQDCGLVYRRPARQKTSKCTCAKLVHKIRWYFDMFFGYDCPSSEYKCKSCGWVYGGLDEAAPRYQKSKAAKEYVEAIKAGEAYITRSSKQ